MIEIARLSGGPDLVFVSAHCSSPEIIICCQILPKSTPNAPQSNHKPSKSGVCARALVIEIARFSRWPYLALVSTHVLILPMSVRAGAISAAAARFQKNAGMTAMKWRQGPDGRTPHRIARPPVPRNAGNWAPSGGVRAWQDETSASTWPRGAVIHGPRARARRFMS